MTRPGGRKGVLRRDALTGAYSGDLLQERLSREIKKAQSKRTPLSLCLLDLDFFKSVNDAYGHNRGDQVLKEFAGRVQALIRGSDAFFRLGGDEFALLLPETSKGQALTIAGRILDEFKGRPFSGAPPVTLSVSIGVAEYPGDALTPESLFESADKRTYEAKHRGRGQVVGEVSAENGDAPFAPLPRLLERDTELKRLRIFLETLPRKKRGVLSVCGLPGTGRTFFLAEAANIARLLNYQIVHLRADWELKQKAYGVFASALHLLPQEMPQRFEEIMRKKTAERNPAGILIILDDLPELDHASLNLFRRLLASSDLPCLGLIYSADPDSVRLLRHPDPGLNESVHLAPLSREGLHIWLRHVLRWEPPAAFLDWLYQETQGFPRLIHESLFVLVGQKALCRRGMHEWEILADLHRFNLGKLLKRRNQTPPNNLPVSLTEFVGRDGELKNVSDLLDKNRLVTLIGPGGIGKTRLALQVARMRLFDFEDGVFFVPLASISRQELLVPAVAKALGIQAAPGQELLPALIENLRGKHRLLILDNFEQLIEAAPVVGEILTAAPLLTALVTSREALKIAGEHVFMVPPLELPNPGRRLLLADLAQQAAVALFASRAQSVRHEFTLTEENACVVAELCRRLDGIPLAIELAAANIGRLTLAEMLEKSRRRLNWLKYGPRDLPQRHQTLQETIAWSYNLLREEEKRLFARLSVFAGGFSREAAVAVAAGGGSDEEVLNGLTALANKCLVQRLPEIGPFNEARFEMLETIREYAAGRLMASDEETELRWKHADYYLRLAERAAEKMSGPEQQIWLDRLELEHSNLRTALEWIKTEGDPEWEIRMVGALGPFWEARGYWNEGRACLEDALARNAKLVPAAKLVKIYHWAGWLVNQQGDCERAATLLKTGFNLARKFEDLLWMAAILHRLGWVLYLQGSFNQAIEKWKKSLAIFRGLGEKPWIAMVLRDLGRGVYFFGDYDYSEALCDESLALSREIGYKAGIARALHWLGEIARAKGDYRRSMKLFQETLRLWEELGDKFGMAGTLFSMAELTRSRREFARAASLYRKHLELSRELGYKPGVAYSLADLGEIARYQKKFGKALKFYEESLALLQEIGENGRMGWVFRDVAEVALHNEDYPQAKGYFQKSLGLLRERSHVMLIPLSLGGLARAFLELGEPVRAARLLGAAESRFEITKAQISFDDLADYEERLRMVRACLGEEKYDRCRDEGKKMGLEQVIAYALEEISYEDCLQT